MAIPVIVGAAFLGTLLGDIGVKLLDFFGRKFARTMATNLMIGTFLIGSLITFVTLIEGLFLSFSLALPAEYAIGMSLVIPSNASVCISAIISVRVARYAYLWTKRVIEMNIQAGMV